jgi:hypothetical protein
MQPLTDRNWGNSEGLVEDRKGYLYLCRVAWNCTISLQATQHGLQGFPSQRVDIVRRLVGIICLLRGDDT